MARVLTSSIGIKPNEVEVLVTLESHNDPVNLQFPAVGAAQFARDISIAATQAMQLGQLPQSELEPGSEFLFAPRATLEEYGEDTETEDVVLRLRDEGGVLHIFRLDPNEVIEFLQHALLHVRGKSASH